MNYLHGTIGKNIFKQEGKTLIQCNLKWNLLRCVTAYGGKHMCRTEKGLGEQIYKAVKM